MITIKVRKHNLIEIWRLHAERTSSNLIQDRYPHIQGFSRNVVWGGGGGGGGEIALVGRKM